MWIKCSDQMPPADRELVFWVIPPDPRKAAQMTATRHDFQIGMFLPEDDPLRPLSWISHWSEDAELGAPGEDAQRSIKRRP